MLDTALKFRRVFSYVDPPNGSKIPENEKPPQDMDWKNIEMLVVFLKGFYRLSTRISGSLYVTSNKGFFEIVYAFILLRKWEKNDDPQFKDMAISMKEKFDKYWGDINKMNMLIYMVVILDPEYKLFGLELALLDMYGKYDGEVLATSVKECAYTLFEEYRRKYAPQSGQNNDRISSQEDDDGGGEDYMEVMRSLSDRIKRKK